jgi:hypothetical protein
MKSFLKLSLLLFFFGLPLEQKSSMSIVEEKCQLDKSELLVYENHGIYHLMNFHRIEYSVLGKTELFSVKERINQKTQPIYFGKVTTY